jgi:hypothetical protein
MLSESDSNTATVDETNEMVELLENDPDVLKLKEQQAELMRLMDDYRVMRSYKKVVNDMYGVGNRKPVSKKEKKKKKAKRRMAKQSKR